jgi:BirA family transcriptional regulator, biotin operon repressor / biotin---[acetyl-CoA-carboxylase] ligase
LNSFWQHEELQVCRSTQTLAIERIRRGEYERPFAISCQRQTDGFGRRGDAWIESGKSVSLSLAWHVDDRECRPDERWPSWISLWVQQALVAYAPKLSAQLKLKWPNDLVVGDKKLGGVLVSQFIYDARTYRVAGIGLNVAWVNPQPNTFSSIDLETVLGRPVEQAHIVQRVLDGVARGLSGPTSQEILDSAVRDLLRTPTVLRSASEKN